MILESVTRKDEFALNGGEIESILINTHLVFNTLNLMNEFTDSTYNIYIACKHLNHNITTTTVTKWLKKHLNKKLTYTTIKTHLEKLELYNYIERYKKHDKIFRLSSELDTTNDIIYGNKDTKYGKVFLNNDKKVFLPLNLLREIDYKKYTSKMYVSENNSEKEFKYQKRAKIFNENFKKQAYSERRRFKFFEDFNYLKYGYGLSRIDFNEKTLKEMKDYPSVRTYFDEVITNLFWYNRPVTKFEIQRVLHTTKASIDQFRCEKSPYYINCELKQNEYDQFIQYKTKSKIEGIVDIKGTAETLLGFIYKRDKYLVRYSLSEIVTEHLFYDTDELYENYKEPVNRFTTNYVLPHEDKHKFNIKTKALDKVSIGLLEDPTADKTVEIDFQTVPLRVISKDIRNRIKVARRRTNNYQSSAFFTEFKTKIMKRIHEKSYIHYIRNNIKRIEHEENSDRYKSKKIGLDKRKNAVKYVYKLLKAVGHSGIGAKKNFNDEQFLKDFYSNKINKHSINRFNFLTNILYKEQNKKGFDLHQKCCDICSHVTIKYS